MRSTHIFELTSLPSLGELGEEPPLTPHQLVEHLELRSGPLKLVRALMLHDDLLQRQAWLAGEAQEVQPVVLTTPQAKNEAPLPEMLQPSPEQSANGAATADPLWEVYFRHVAVLAKDYPCPFLGSWVTAEVSLRNALVRARAGRLGLDASEYLVAEELADPTMELSEVVNAWAAAANPLEGWRVLIRWRWGWVSLHDAWFTFQDDELTAYAAKLMLLTQWRRLDAAESSNPD
jgi:hypothetical protein